MAVVTSRGACALCRGPDRTGQDRTYKECYAMRWDRAGAGTVGGSSGGETRGLRGRQEGTIARIVSDVKTCKGGARITSDCTRNKQRKKSHHHA